MLDAFLIAFLTIAVCTGLLAHVWPRHSLTTVLLAIALVQVTASVILGTTVTVLAPWFLATGLWYLIFVVFIPRRLVQGAAR